MNIVYRQKKLVSFFGFFSVYPANHRCMFISALTLTLLLAFVHGCRADDLLKPGDQTVKDTFGKDSSIMTWLLIGEVITAIVAYVATKNIKVLFGVIVLSVFITIAAAVIGI
ncbi:type IV conjugative transfer system pilin TraA [Pantoea agglomerans]|jgi:type IV conjugative transfer system pilin TraA|uniref:type IV conjugative transfer system pilin TraA n=1 Tax=Enterobacter agglomerans TaxID=549 RepID=UPI001048C577|nr:type IV conjugative transfer system pilin TraA [Pantoea agglomerans]MDQ0431157.1 type IV conjugative transfer system pilin TraA [Pantoea agglomerans]NEG84651.1 type IV conjugative transfer system pilin TraA [Pantoea agglomerans]NEH06792.1 type IV conjugative transfer system pilin TraA [Pantoea agglomerans]TCZ24167.1 type IV conjugative transfer system pilin TraA [Pantoea agglomerans]